MTIKTKYYNESALYKKLNIYASRQCLFLEFKLLDYIMVHCCYSDLAQADPGLFCKWCDSCISACFTALTCGKDDILGNELMVHDGELGQFDLIHPRHGIVFSSPVELNVICSVTI